MTAHGGYLFGSPLGFTTKRDSSVVMKAAGFFVPSNSMDPDFSRIPGDWIGTSSQKIPGPILAMSLGLDKLNIPAIDTVAADDLGPLLLEVPENGWIAFEYVIDAAVFDKTEMDGCDLAVDPIIRAVPDSAIRSTVFNCLVPGSVVDANPEGCTPQVGLVPKDLDIATPSLADEVLGMDLHVALFDANITNSNSFFTGLLPKASAGEVRVFFSLTPDFISAASGDASLMQGWQVGPGAPDATIFVSYWHGTSSGWSKPTAYRHLPSGKQGPITALCIDTNHGSSKDPTGSEDETHHRILVSRRLASLDDKVEVALAGTGPTMGVLRNLDYQEPGTPGAAPNKKRVSRLVGAGRGLGDMCTADPKSIHGPILGSEVPTSFLDDFAIARRIAHPVLGTGGELSTSGFLIGKRILQPFPVLTGTAGAATPHGGAGLEPGSHVPPFPLLRPHLRTMMNARRLRVGSKVVVDWYLVSGDPSTWQPIGCDKFVWKGMPLFADRVFPAAGGLFSRFYLAAIWRSGKRASPACVLRLR